MLSFFSNASMAKEWSFDVYADGKKIGEHSFSLTESGPYNHLISKADYKITLFNIPIYRYHHVSDELWNKDCLISITSSTQDGREDYKVRGETTNNVFELREPAQESFKQECPMTFSYWNPEMLNQTKLLNVQTGKYIEVEIKNLGKESIQVKNESIEADKFSVTGRKINLTLWYKDNKEWLRLQAVTPDNHHISYELKQ